MSWGYKTILIYEYEIKFLPLQFKWSVHVSPLIITNHIKFSKKTEVFKVLTNHKLFRLFANDTQLLEESIKWKIAISLSILISIKELSQLENIA